MTLIKSISGIRGTIGGESGNNLTPLDIVKFTAAYAIFIKESTKNNRPLIVVGKDARISGEMVHRIITGTLMAWVVMLQISEWPLHLLQIAVKRECIGWYNYYCKP